MGKTKTYTISMGFFIEEANTHETAEYKISVPKKVNLDEVKEVLLKEYNNGMDFKTPIELINYVCKKYKWEWDSFNFDIDFYLD